MKMLKQMQDEHSGDYGEGDADGKNSRILRLLPPQPRTRNWTFAGKPFPNLRWNGNALDQSRHGAIETLLLGKFVGAASAEDRCAHGTVVYQFFADGRAARKKTLPARQANDSHFASFCGTVASSHA